MAAKEIRSHAYRGELHEGKGHRRDEQHLRRIVAGIGLAVIPQVHY